MERRNFGTPSLFPEGGRYVPVSGRLAVPDTEDGMRRSSHLPAWLDRRGFSAATKARIAAALALSSRQTSPMPDEAVADNVLAFPSPNRAADAGATDLDAGTSRNSGTGSRRTG